MNRGSYLMSLSAVIQEIGNTYIEEKETGEFKGAPVGNLVKHKMVEELRNIEELKEFKIKGSIGNGRFADIPWVAIMDTNITETTTKGIDVVFLFSSDGENVYLTLNQGATYFNEKKFKKSDIVKISNLIYKMLDSPESKPIDIDLKSETSLGKSYETTTISGFKYEINNMPDSSKIKQDLIKLLNDYKLIKAIFEDNNNDVGQFYNYILNSENKTKKYQSFKILFQKFVEQSQKNIINKNKSNVIQKEGLEDLEIRKVRDFNIIKIEDINFHIHLFNNGQYGRKNGNGSGKIPYICYQFSNGRWATIRTTFENYKMSTVRITLWDEINQIELETDKSYDVENFDLFSDNPPNEYFKQFYDDYIIYIKEVKSMVENKIVNEMTEKLLKSKNIILRGAPGTGKSYLAKQIASKIIGESTEEIESSEQFEFVQFHPNYDYTDFVEGIRPIINNGDMGFKLKSGVFKTFCDNARKAQINYDVIEDGEKYENYIENENKIKKYVFVIDEINRGEISKIFGELFFSIDPSYRGISGAVKTQYSNMESGSERFFIPDNVFIIGTMNDIDRSVDTFDFAMRRRFRFIEIKANENVEMLEILEDKKEEAITRMVSLNNVISQVEGLDSNYHIGAAYFLKLKYLNYEELWEDYLEPLLADYITGMFNEEEIMESFKMAYHNPQLEIGLKDESD